MDLVRLAASGVGQVMEQHQFVGARELVEERASGLWRFIARGFCRTCLAQFVA
jgi:hypothetical protein